MTRWLALLLPLLPLVCVSPAFAEDLRPIDQSKVAQIEHFRAYDAMIEECRPEARKLGHAPRDR